MPPTEFWDNGVLKLYEQLLRRGLGEPGGPAVVVLQVRTHPSSQGHRGEWMQRQGGGHVLYDARAHAVNRTQLTRARASLYPGSPQCCSSVISTRTVRASKRP